jgi:DNA-binding NarL/FixJ family response regulator
VKVLILEDDPDVGLWASNAFSFLGGIEDVELVSDQFRQLFDEDRWEGVDVFVTDWMVPDFRVLEIMRWVSEHFPHIRIVIYTAAEMSGIDHGGYADKVIQKGTPFEDLIGAIRG